MKYAPFSCKKRRSPVKVGGMIEAMKLSCIYIYIFVLLIEFVPQINGVLVYLFFHSFQDSEEKDLSNIITQAFEPSVMMVIVQNLVHVKPQYCLSHVPRFQAVTTGLLCIYVFSFPEDRFQNCNVHHNKLFSCRRNSRRHRLIFILWSWRTMEMVLF